MGGTHPAYRIRSNTVFLLERSVQALFFFVCVLRFCLFCFAFPIFQTQVDTPAEKKGKSNTMEKQNRRCWQPGTALVWHWSVGSQSISEQRQRQPQQPSVSEQVSECLGNSTKMSATFLHLFKKTTSCRQCSGA